MLFSTIKMIIFWTCKNLLNNKSLKGYQNHCVKWLWKVFGGRRPSSKLTLKTKWYNSCGYCDNSRSCEQLKRHVTDKYFEKNWALNLNLQKYQGPFCQKFKEHHMDNWNLEKSAPITVTSLLWKTWIENFTLFTYKYFNTIIIIHEIIVILGTILCYYFVVLSCFTNFLSINTFPGFSEQTIDSSVYSRLFWYSPAPVRVIIVNMQFI